LMWLGAFGALILLVAALVLPIWPLLGLYWYLHGGGWPAVGAIGQSLTLWALILYVRARVAVGMGISPWYALTLPPGAAVFAAMMFTSTWRVISGKGVAWKGRIYTRN